MQRGPGRDGEPGLIQVRHGKGDAWRVGCICIIMRQTDYRQVESVLPHVFRRYPCAASMVGIDEADLSYLLVSTGLQRTKAHALVMFSEDTVAGVPFGDRRGVGPYARDAYHLLIEGDTARPGVTDKALKRWQDWAVAR